MNRLLFALLTSAALSFSGPAHPAEYRFPNHSFTVPDGFEVELVAGPPLVNRPIVADFDEQGRLYVADSSGSNEKTDKQLQEKPHRIIRLEDTDGDGRFDKSTVFADKMMFPEGAMWFDGSLYVGAPPSIWKLTDTDGDGIADKREEWFQGKTLTGCANDLHGPYLGPDGWIYWCKGAFAKQTYQRPAQPPFVTRAAHIFRCRPDGSGIEPVMTGGMDNPVEVAFTPSGERIITTTFFQHPGGGQRDGLIHAIYGGVYGKAHDVLDDHKKTGELMPVLTQLGPAAPCGFTRYAARVFGDEFQDNFFACLFNLHKVTRHVLESNGATFKSRDTDFLSSDNPDFHPTDVLEDADGSLLVIDTGGWYKLCCPTSQLWKPDVLGAIYRVRRKGAPSVQDPRGLRLPWGTMKLGELAKLLSDDRPAVRNRAIQELAKQGNEAVPTLAETMKSSGSIEARRNAVWALTRIEGEDARNAVRASVINQDDSVRQAALHSMSVWRDSEADMQLRYLLRCANPQIRRCAAEAAGRIGDKSMVPELLEAAAGIQHDRVLEHSVIYAMIEIADPIRTAAGLQESNSFTKRAALIALDQMTGGGLKPEMVTPLLVSTDSVLKETASWIVGHHPEWGSALAGFFRERLAADNLNDSDRVELQHQLAQFARDSVIQSLLASELTTTNSFLGKKQLVLRAIAQASLKEIPSDWLAGLRVCLGQKDEPTLRSVIATLRAISNNKTNAPDFTEPLLCIAHDSTWPADLRLDALAAVPNGLKSVEPDLFQVLCENAKPEKPVLVRTTAAGVLGKAKLTSEQLLALTESVKAAGPLEMPKLLSAFENTTDERLGLKLVAALKQSAGLSGLRAETLKPRLTNFPILVQQQGEELLASINLDAPKQKAHLDELALNLHDGDVRRGQAVFNSQKGACSSCHAIGYLGGNIGPDLTRIGQIRNERDLLEAIVYPSASFVRSYEPMVVVTRSGEESSGVLRKDGSDEIVLATGPSAEVRIARADIAEMRPGTVSVMPGGLDEQLSRQELADLLAFLKATKW